MHLCFELELQRPWRDCSDAHSCLSFRCSHMQSIDCVSKLSMTSKCTYVLRFWRDCWNAQTRLSFPVARTSSIACLCLLNAIIFWMALAKLLRCADSSGLLLPCNKNRRRLCDLLMFWLRVVKTLATHFCANSSKVCSPWRDCAISQRLNEQMHYYFGKQMLERYKMRPSFPPLKRWFF